MIVSNVRGRSPVQIPGACIQPTALKADADTVGNWLEQKTAMPPRRMYKTRASKSLSLCTLLAAGFHK